MGGGAENRLYRFLQNADSSRVEPVVALLGSGSLERAISELGIRTYALPPARMRQIGKALRTTRALTRVLKDERPDVVLSWGRKAQMLASPAVRLAGLDAQVVWFQTDLPGGPADRLATALPASAVACVSEYVAGAQAHLRPHRPTFVVYPGMDPPPNAPREELEELRASLSIPPGREVIGTVGRIEERKRPDLLVRALAGLRDRGYDVQGLIVGGDAWDGDMRYVKSVHQLVRELELGDRITFTGHVDNPAPYLQLMDVYVHTCPVEASGNALIEAMGLGIASIAVGRAGPAEIIAEGQSGLLASSPDPTLVEQAIGQLLDDEGMRRRFAESGMQRQRELFSASHMATELEDRLLELATPASSE
jgi:glycosyltransferase involved in cell wall biosynthesis